MLSVWFNKITDDGLDTLLMMALKLVTLDLEANKIVFDINSPAVDKLWSADSALRHLNISHNSQTKQSLTYLFRGVGLSKLLTLDTAMSRYPVRKVPARLIPYLLRNRTLERVDLRGIQFCTFPTEGALQLSQSSTRGAPWDGHSRRTRS